MPRSIEQNLNELCKCPYCFGKFLPNNAVFKAETVYTKQDLEGINDDINQFLEADDPVYKRFWDKYPGTETHFEYEKHAVISANPRMGLQGTPHPDAEGFYYEMSDSQGERSKIRICPHCHNPLPFEFGKYPVKYIAVVGITSSGKTVYLSQLMHRFRENLIKCNLSVIGTYNEIEAFVKRYPVRRGEPLPQGTTAAIFTPPLPVNVKNNETEERYTLVFYDIAGENCVNPDKMDTYGPFISNADGMILIVDPKQFDQIFTVSDNSARSTDDTYSPDKVISAMYNSFLASQNVGGKSMTPLAATISKSDLLKQCMNENNAVFRNIDYKDGFGFNRNDWNNVNTTLKLWINQANSMQGQLFLSSLNNCFETHSFFAISALNCAPEVEEDAMDPSKKRYVLSEEPDPIRIEAPIAWLLHEMGIVECPGEAKPKKRGLFN